MKGNGSELLFHVILGNKLGRGLRKAALAHGISSCPDFRVSRSTTARQWKETTQIPDTPFKATSHIQIQLNSNLSRVYGTALQSLQNELLSR